MTFREIVNFSVEPQIPRTETTYSQAAYGRELLTAEDEVNFKTLRDRKLLYILYRRDPICNKVINTRASLAVARGFKIISRDDEERKIIKNFIKGFHRTDPVTALIDRLRNLSIDTGWAGDGWWERVYNENNADKKMISVAPIHPLTMDYKRNAQGEILFDDEGDFGKRGEFLSYYEKVEQRERDIDKNRVAHSVFNQIGDELLGMSDLEPIYKTTHRRMSIEDGIAQGAFRHGVPFLDVTVGDPGHPPTKEMMDTARDEVRGSSYLSEYVHPPWYKVNMFEQFSLGKSAKILDPFYALTAGNSGIPIFVLLGTGEKLNKATAEKLIDMLPPLVIDPMQAKLKLFLEDQIFAPLLESHGIKEPSAQIQWNEVFPANQSFTDKIKTLATITIQGKPLISWIEAREMLKLPSPEAGSISKLSRQNLSEMQAIYLTHPHGSLIHKGMKKAIVKSRLFESMINKPLLLVSKDTAYGKISLQKPKLIDLEEFKKTFAKHRVSEKERLEWWADREELYLYPFKIIKMFQTPKKVNIPHGVQTFIKSVNLSQVGGEATIDVSPAIPRYTEE